MLVSDLCNMYISINLKSFENHIYVYVTGNVGYFLSIFVLRLPMYVMLSTGYPSFLLCLKHFFSCYRVIKNNQGDEMEHDL